MTEALQPAYNACMDFITVTNTTLAVCLFITITSGLCGYLWLSDKRDIDAVTKKYNSRYGK